jgi:hypothetical protein
MPAELLTFQATLGGCARGNIRNWRFFASRYGPLAEHLLPHRFGLAADLLRSRLPDFFASLSENGNAFFREFSGFNEQEFVVSFQYRLFDFSRGHVGPINRTGVSLNAVNQVFGKLPLAHQEPGWLALKGYSDEVIGKILRVPLSLVKVGRTVVVKGLNEFADPDAGPGMLNDSLLVELEKCGGPSCPEIKAFCKVMDGRMPWQDKRNVEQHIAECRHCLDLETSLKNGIFHLRILPPLPDDKVQSLLSLITFSKAAAAARRSILEKVLRVFR